MPPRHPRGRAAIPRWSRGATVAEWQQETWMRDSAIPCPSPAHIQTLIARCHRLSAPGDRLSTHDAQVAHLCQAVILRQSLGWGVARDLWRHYRDTPSRQFLLVFGGFRYPGPWWTDADFASAAVAALEQMPSTMRQTAAISTFEHGLATDVLPEMYAVWPARRWFRTVAWVGESSGYPDLATQLLARVAAPRPHRAIVAADLLPLFTHPRADLRCWAQLQLTSPETPDETIPRPTTPRRRPFAP